MALSLDMDQNLEGTLIDFPFSGEIYSLTYKISCES